jgi:hypothetical protein
VYSFRSPILFVMAWPLVGLGAAVAEGGAREALALLVPAGALIAAAGLTVLRDRDDIANHVEWGWSTVGHGRQAGLFVGASLTLLGAGTFLYGVIGASQALTA